MLRALIVSGLDDELEEELEEVYWVKASWVIEWMSEEELEARSLGREGRYLPCFLHDLSVSQSSGGSDEIRERY